MPVKAKKSKKPLTIQSSETRITAGIVLFIAGLGGILSAFMADAAIFAFTAELVGKSSIIWGLATIYIALRMITLNSKFKSFRFFFGLIVLAIVLSIFLTFFVPQEELILLSNYSAYGGTLGFAIHDTLYQIFGPILEFIIIFFIAIIGITLITPFTLEQITNALVNFFGAIFGIFNKKTQEVTDGLIINLNDPEVSHKPEVSISKDKKEVEFLENGSGIIGGMLGKTLPQNSAQNSTLNNNGSNEKNPGITIATNGKSNTFIENNPNTQTNENKSSNSSENEDTNFFEPMYPDWKYPSSIMFKEPVYKPQNPELHKKNAEIIEKTLRSFGIESRVNNIAVGPTVVQYALSITVGTKVAKVKNLANDLALSLAATSAGVRIEAPIPGTSLIGIEIPNPTPNFVYVRELLSDLEKEKEKYELPIVLGKNVTGQRIIKDLTEMPHLLVAGATGTGKSVGINSILAGLLSTKSPDELRVILVDPKMVEMAPFNGIPHLLIPVITDMELVINALQWAVEEMMRRYRILKQLGVRKIKEYNQKLGYNALPYIVIIIDEMADLMLTTGVDVESKIVRLTQMSRAVGIHLILATQRPSVNVITGLIKANVPSRMSFAVATAIDSRVIIDQTGAETLIGKGDMLFKSPEYPRPIRVQDAWTDTKDIENLVSFIKEQTDEVHYFDDITKSRREENTGDEKGGSGGDFSDDSMFEDALAVVVNAQKASASLLQRKLRIGYNRAARLIEELEEAGAVGPADGSNARKVLVSSPDQILNKQRNNDDSFINDFDEGNGNVNGIEDAID